MKRGMLSSTILVIMLLSSCGKDDPVPEICLPTSLIIGSDSISFEYSSENRLSKLIYYRYYQSKNPAMIKIDNDELEYNAQGQLAKLTQNYTYGNPKEFEITYKNNLPYQAKASSVFSPKSDPVIVEFSHDSEGRLIRIQQKRLDIPDYLRGVRYEYSDKENVSKMYVQIPGFKDEKIARENFTFDTSPVFYAGSKELKFIDEYLYEYLPNKNNCLSFSFSGELSTLYTSGFSWLAFTQAAQTAKYISLYNNKGLVQSWNKDPNTFNPKTDVYFRNVLYNCK